MPIISLENNVSAGSEASDTEAQRTFDLMEEARAIHHQHHAGEITAEEAARRLAQLKEGKSFASGPREYA